MQNLNNMIRNAQAEFVSRVGVAVPEATIVAIFNMDTEFWDGEAEYYTDENEQKDPHLGFDTMPRDILLDGFAQLQFGLTWPLYGSTAKETSTFWRALEAFVTENGGEFE